MSYYKLIIEAMYDPDHDLVFEHAKEADKEIEQLEKENESMQSSIGSLVAMCKNRSSEGFVHSAPIPNKDIIEMLEKHVKS